MVQTGKEIIKRWIIWFILAAVIVILVVSAITATTVVLDKKIDAVNNSLATVQEKVEKITTAFHQQGELNNETLKAVEALLMKTDQMLGGMHEFANVVPEMIWTGNKIHEYLEESKKALQQLSEECKKGRIDTEALAHILGHPDIKKLKKEDTKIESIRRINQNTIKIEFTSPSVVEDTMIYQVVPFRFWTNLTTEPRLLEYAGPEFAMHNYTSNCTKGLSRPETSAVYETCKTTDYGDKELQLWRVIDAQEDDNKPQIMKTRSNTYIYCMFNNITIEGETYQCPPFVFKLPALQGFAIGNITHGVNLLRLNSTTDATSFRVKHINATFHDDDFDNQLALINSIRKLNKQIGETLKTDGEFIKIPWNSISFWSWNLLTIATLIVGIIGCLIKCATRKDDQHNEYITVVNQAPKPIEMKNMYPEINTEKVHYEEI